MKNFALLLTLLAGLNSISAQEFEPTNAYKVTSNDWMTQEQEVGMHGVLLSDTEQSLKLTTFPLEAAQSIEQITVHELKNPGLKGISLVLKIETQYIEYCSYLVSHYILVTRNGDYISLPSIGNTRCNDTKTEVQYVFPSQKLGVDNQIVRAEVHLNGTTQQHPVTQQIFIWEDDSFGTIATISETN